MRTIAARFATVARKLRGMAAEHGFDQLTSREIEVLGLLASWLVAVVFTPYLGVKLLPAIKPVAGGHEAIYQTPRYQKARRLIRWAVENKRLVTGATLAALLVAGLGMALVKQQFFPASDRPEVLVEIQLPKGTAIERTTAATQEVEAWLRKQPETEILTAYLGQAIM